MTERGMSFADVLDAFEQRRVSAELSPRRTEIQEI